MSKSFLRLAVAFGTALTMLVTVATAAPSQAAVRAPGASRLVVHATPATALAGSVVVLTGSVTPRVAGAPVLVQRLVGKAWHTLSRQKVSAAGTVVVSVRAPRTIGAWTLRVTRAATSGAKPAVSGVLRIRVVSKAFAVTATTPATATLGAAAVVTGAVTRKGVGSVWLQQLVGKTWKNVASAKLTHSTFTAHATLPLGVHRLRVTKAFSSTVAGGVSKAFSLTVVTPAVAPAPPSPQVTSATLPAAMARRPYTATLTATSGTAPYTWTATGLPSGITLASDGSLSGTPSLAAVSSVVVTVHDAGGRTGSATLGLTVSRTAGTVWAWGIDDAGELGDGTANSSSVPVAGTGLTDVVQLASSGFGDVYAVRADGTVRAWGAGTYGALGNDGVVTSTSPVVVTGLTGVTQVAAGLYAGAALASDGTVWTWGYGGNYQLGNGSLSDSHVPVHVANLTGVTAVAAYSGATYALKSDGTVWAWGGAAEGALGNGSVTSTGLPVQVSSLVGVVAIAASDAGGYALKSDHTVWAWGGNAHGELGNGSAEDHAPTPEQVQGITDAVAISGGLFAGLALRSDGTVWDWGYNQYGALGNNSTVNSSVPVAVSGLANVTTIAGGGQDGYAVKGDGSAWAWGANHFGQLGNGTTADSSIPVPVAVLRGIFAVAGGNSDGYAINLG